MRRISAIGLAITAALLLAESAAACSCAPVPAREMLRQADGAVVARLLAVRPIDDGDDLHSSGDPTDFVYRTGQVVKGRARLARGRRLVVRSVRSDASCGLSSDVGALIGLFLTRSDGRWTSGSCLEIEARPMRRLARRGTSGSDRGGC